MQLSLPQQRKRLLSSLAEGGIDLVEFQPCYLMIYPIFCPDGYG
jgi:hypothetical protein